jgi:prepilin-type N-terminal cleavage/methylation domain-containing protein
MKLFNFKNKYCDRNNFKAIERGFTLIELMVSIALFTTVALIATTALTSIQKVNVRVQNVRTVMDNLALSLETISSEVRQGSNYHCYESESLSNNSYKMNSAQNCDDSAVVKTNNENALIFKVNSDKEVSTAGSEESPRVAYMLVKNADGAGTIIRYRNSNVYGITDNNFSNYFTGSGCSNSGCSAEQVTSSDVNVTKLKFTVNGEGQVVAGTVGDGQQPYVLIEIEGETRSTPPQSFKLQTVVTSRNVSY